MPIISKLLFDSKIGPGINCQQLLHPWTDSCITANLKMMLNVSKGVLIFYLPIHLMRLLLDYKKINKKRVKNIVIAFLKSQSFGLGAGFFLISTYCLEINMLKRLHYFNFAFFPGIVSGLAIFFESPEARYLNTLLFLSMVFEAFFCNVYYFKIISYSPIKETFIFMMISGFLMHLLNTAPARKLPLNLWFYKPSKPHSEIRLSELVLNEFLKYFGIGYSLSVARKLVSKMSKLFISPSKTLIDCCINKNNLKLGLLCGSYALLYKVTSILLQKYNNKRRYLNNAFAGIIAGLAYRISPTINILTIALVTILQVLCVNFQNQGKILTKVPVTELLFVLSHATLLFNRLCIQDTCPKYYKNMLRVASNGLFEEIYNNVIKTYLA